MRRLRTLKEIEKKNRRNQLIVGAVLIFVLVFSIAGFGMNKSKNTSTNIGYNGFEFIQTNNLWRLDIQEASFYFQYLPQSLDNVSISGFYALQDYIDKPLYFVGDESAVPEIINNLGPYILRYQKACLENMTCEENLPVKNCSNNIIIFNASDKTTIYKKNNCVYISGNLIKGADAFLYKLLKVR